MENELGIQKMKKSRYIAIRISYRDTILISCVLRYINISIYCDTLAWLMVALRIYVAFKLAIFQQYHDFEAGGNQSLKS